jgi:hypothetical protein
VEDAEYIDNFHTILRRFFQALGGIVPIFTYMVSSPVCCLPVFLYDVLIAYLSIVNMCSPLHRGLYIGK